jgi:hypothetical protein
VHLCENFTRYVVGLHTLIVGQDGRKINGEFPLFDEQPFFDDKGSLTPTVLGGFLHVGEVSLRRQPANALGVEQAGLNVGESLVRLPALRQGPGDCRGTPPFSGIIAPSLKSSSWVIPVFPSTPGPDRDLWVGSP